MGWILSLTNIYPFYKTNLFWTGVLASITLFFFIVSISIFKLKNKSRQFQIASIFISLIFVGITSVSYNIYLLNNEYKEQSKSLEENIELQSKISLSNLEINKVENVAALIKQISKELNSKEVRTLSDTSILKIKSLSNSLTPFYYFDGNTLSSIKLSPGRGQLLIALCNLNIDSSSFSRIIKTTNFSNVWLKNADFSGSNLNGINLEGSYLKSCVFKGGSMENANLKNSIINECDFTLSSMNKSDLSLSQILKTDFSNSLLLDMDFNGIKGSNSVFYNCILRNSSFQWSDLIGARLNSCDLEGSDFWGSNLSNANLSNSNFKNSRLLEVNLNRSILKNVTLDNIAVSEDWINTSNVKESVGFDELNRDYSIKRDSSKKYKIQKFFLKRKT